METGWKKGKVTDKSRLLFFIFVKDLVYL